MGKKRKHCSTQFLQQVALDDSLFKSYSNTSSDGKISLVISKQPEKQHRARYHTEGSRGAVKDRAQSSFPTVQLRGYNPKKLAVLQVFVGSDTGTPIPHLYYQACKVSGKNSTPCREMKKENTGPSMSLPKQFYTIQYTCEVFLFWQKILMTIQKLKNQNLRLNLAVVLWRGLIVITSE